MKNTVTKFIETVTNIHKISESDHSQKLDDLLMNWENLQQKQFTTNNIELREFQKKLKLCFKEVNSCKPVEPNLSNRSVKVKRFQALSLSLDHLRSLNNQLNKDFENEFKCRNTCAETNKSDFNNFIPTKNLIINTRENPKLTNDYKISLNEAFLAIEESHNKSRQMLKKISQLSLLTMSMIALNETHTVQHLIDIINPLINNVDLNKLALDSTNPEISPTKNRAFTMLTYLYSYNFLNNNEKTDQDLSNESIGWKKQFLKKYKNSGIAALTSLPIALATGSPRYLLHCSQALPLLELITPIAESKFKKFSSYLAATSLTMYSLMFESLATAVAEGTNSFLITAMKDKVLEIKDSNDNRLNTFMEEGFFNIETFIHQKVDLNDSHTFDHFHDIEKPIRVQLKNDSNVDIIAFNPSENLYLVKKSNENDFAYILDLNSIDTNFWDYTYETHLIDDTEFSLIINKREHQQLQKNRLSKMELMRTLEDGPLLENNGFKLYKIRDLFCVETQDRAWVSLDMASKLFDLDTEFFKNNEDDEENKNLLGQFREFFNSASDTLLEHYLAPIFQ